MNPILYPLKYSEFEVQAEMYWKLKELGLDVRGEVRSPVDDLGEKAVCRMDLVIFDTLQRPIAIIECKNKRQKKPRKFGTLFIGHTRQHRRYALFELPVFQCLSMNHVPLVLNAIEEHINVNTPTCE